MDKLNMGTKNIANENIEKIGQLFPECITEINDGKGKTIKAVDFAVLNDIFNYKVINYSTGGGQHFKECYQFIWPDKSKARAIVNQPINATLRPCREESVNFDTTENLYIEGDNLDVLKLLRETYYGKVKMIYIDPPYNTGNDFVYEDDFSQDVETYKAISGQYDNQGNRLQKNQESNGRFHTDWLNMMYPRLKIARDFLSDDGVIFISIDDNEVDNLRKICDEIFGEKNFSTSIVWQKKTGASDAKGIATITENIVVYAKDKGKYAMTFTKNKESYDINRYRYKDEFVEKRGPYYIDNLDRGGLSYSDSLNFGIKCPDGSITFPNGRKEYVNDGWIWKWSKQKIEWARKNKFIEFRKTDKKGSGWSVCYKNYLCVNNEGEIIERAAPHKNLINDVLNTDAAANMKTLFGTNNYFDYSKPVELIKKLIGFVHTNESLIIDFFSGSATTAHAVMQLNAEDGENRKYIMVQLPEACDEKSEAYKAGYKNICEIGKERIRRAGKKLLEEQKNKAGDLFSEGNSDLDVGFRVLKLDSSNMEKVYYRPEDLSQDALAGLISNIKEGRTDEDLLFQVMLDLGVLLSSKIETEVINGKKVFNVNKGYLMACFDENVDEDLITAVAKKEPTYFVMRDSSLANDSVLVNFDQIFEKYSPKTTRKVL